MTVARPKQSLLFAALLTSALLALPGHNASAQQITYYDFNTPQANTSQYSYACSATAVNSPLFCFNGTTGDPSFLLDTFPAPIDPILTDNPPVSGSWYATQMTPSAGGQSSSMWFSVPQVVANGFTSWFAFKFTPNSNSYATADGLAFVIQNSQGVYTPSDPIAGCVAAGAGPTALGTGGGCLSYGGIDNSLALEFDTYNNGAGFDPDDLGGSYSDNHIALQNCGAGVPNSPVHYSFTNASSQTENCQVSLGGPSNTTVPTLVSNPQSSTPGNGTVTLADGNVHQVVVIYSGSAEATPNLLQVYIDPPYVPGTHTPASNAVPVISGTYNLATALNLINSGTANDSAYIGFTSATGSAFEEHELMAWTFTPHAQVQQTQPVNSSPSSPTTTTFYFGTHNYSVTYPPNTVPAGTVMTVIATPISQAAFDLIIAGTPFAGAMCQVYDDTGNNCIVYNVSCTNAGTPVACPAPSGAPQDCAADPTNPDCLTLVTSYDNSTQPTTPGFLQGDPFYAPVSSIVSSGTSGTVNCSGECGVTTGQAVNIVQNNGTPIGQVTVGTVAATNQFPFSSTGTIPPEPNGGVFLTSANVQNIFTGYSTNTLDGSTTGSTHTYSDFISTSLTPAFIGTQTQLTANSNPATVNQSDLLTATISVLNPSLIPATGAGSVATGTVTFSAGLAPICQNVSLTPTSASTYMATCSYTPTAAPSVSLTASYTGDPYYTPSTFTLNLPVNPATYLLNVVAGSGGTVTASNGQQPAQSIQSITATPSTGYYFSGWTGSLDIANPALASTTVTMNGPENITANFAPIPGYLVNSASDDPPGNAANCPSPSSCTLRDAILTAEANNGGAGTITFSPAAFPLDSSTTIPLSTSPLPALTGKIDIQGPGTNVVIVSGSSSTAVGSIFQVNSGATVSISGLTIANGKASDGGGIVNNGGNLTVASCILSGNFAQALGAAIDNNAGSLTVSDSTFSSNSTSNTPLAEGGGIYNAPGAALTVSYSTFSSNISGNYGGAIDTYGPATISNSTFSGNQASVYGGAIVSENPNTVTVTNSIFAGNSAFEGAGLLNIGATLNANTNLFYQNLDNLTGGNGAEDDCLNCTSNTKAIYGLSPNLAPLAFYKGPTPTLLPLPASAAICAASSALIPVGITKDQRGFPNTTTYNSTACYDLGAVQTNYALSFTGEPPATGTLPGTAMSPAPAVTVTETHSALTTGSISLTAADANSDLTTTPATATTTAGVATFGSLIFTGATTGDKLTATLALNPNDTAINLTTQSTSFSVGAATPTVTWPTASAITYGQPLSASNLTGGSASFNSTNVPGSFAFASPTTTPTAGLQSESVTFTPSTSAYNSVTSTINIQVNKATPTVTWPTATAITFGQMLSASTLNGGSAVSPITSATVPGGFAFTNPTLEPAVGTAPQSVTFTPGDTTDYASVTSTVSVQVNTATPTVTWPTASAITFGQTLVSSNLTGGSAVVGSTPVTGAFAFTTPSTAPNAGTQTESVTFTPGSSSYNSVTSTVSVLVNKATPTVTWPTAGSITYGQTLASSTLIGGSAVAPYTSLAVTGSFAFTTPLSVPNAGTAAQSVTFTPGSANYAPVTSTVSVTVNQATPTVTWPTASAITFGETLASSTLSGGSAKSPITGAAVSGAFTFTTPTTAPTATALQSVTFTPALIAGVADYKTVTSTVTVTLTPVPLVAISPTTIPFGTNIYLGTILAKTVTITNTGDANLIFSGDPFIAILSGGDSNEFGTINLCPTTLAAGKSCTMIVGFVAGPYYTPQTAELKITDNAAGSPQIVQVSATVIDPVASFSATSLSFGTAKTNSGTVTKMVTLSNPGGTALSITGYAFAGADPHDFSETNACPASLAPKSNCVITVTFKPTVKAARTATLVVTDNAFNSPQSIPLSGTGN